MFTRKVVSIPFAFLGLTAMTGFALAQDQTPHAWRNADDPAPRNQQPYYDAGPSQGGVPYPDQAGAPYPNQGAPGRGNPGPANAPYPQDPRADSRQQNPPPVPENIPARLEIRPGTYLTVRTGQWLSSDRNHQGESFSATLSQPLVIDGIVVAQRGQTVGGRITEAQKAGRVEGVSRLGIEIIDVTLADGQVVPIQSQMISRDGRTSQGRDAGAIAGTTALGAAIGAAAGWGKGAAIGAGAGAAAGILGVLLTRGEPTVIHPETELTFKVTAPVEISTNRAPQAFHYADYQDYERQPAGLRGPQASCYNCAPPPPEPYPYYRYPAYPYYGSGFSLYVGPRFYYGPRFRGYYYGRGFRR